ncbi:MAG: AraC family transcriptional regulator [Calditrichaeota bacterium]|nr:AraC family transcriptional regulator [Calditrichota bacterium]
MLLFAISFNSLFPLILTVAAIQGMILSLFIFLKKQGTGSGNFLAVFVLSFSLPTLNFALFNSSLSPFLGPRVLFEPCVFLFGPSFYLYLKYRKRNPALSPSEIFHLLPFLFFMSWELAFFTGLIDRFYPYEELSACSALIYAVLIYRTQRRTKENRDSFTREKRIIAACYFLYLCFSLSFLLLIYFQSGSENRLLMINTVGLLISILLYAIAYVSLWQDRKSTETKYMQSALNDELADSILNGFRRLIDQKIYLQNKLNLASVAAQLDTSPRYLSQVINDHFKLTFPQYMNALRIEEAKRLLLESDEDPKLLAVALDSGFSNKVSFFHFFKKQTGLTPGEFKLQQK